MDVQQYISSGIIEAYVLGIASGEEVRELELLSAQHPEIAAAIEEQQRLMEDFASSYHLPPPEGLKESIWDKLEQEATGKAVPFPAAPAAQEQPVTTLPQAETKTRRLYTPLAAAVALLVISLVFNVMSWQRTRSSEHELAAIKSQQENILAGNRQLQQQMEQNRKHMAMMMDPAMKPVHLAGVGDHVTNNAMLMWDTRTKDVYLSLKDLPKPPAGKQYQLWAIVDGKPVDAGVYDMNTGEMMQKMKVIPAAQMFAITLEKEGGSPTPTLTEMYVAGKV
ncbi:anti-sigma factor [Taibaiella chishuiensis]|uniref:Anti-sigma-K factor RskA n=1 Tax=Taibaiella chishuiensis TaxID=1434707 RepID=A0A2P8D452_9BACT|nr:anti-sigma factor [Taibaiella chishuiensis]PSK92008.1 anti-sigma-K factor RskA [Taibaiella chishuiensis]